jgi:hypothetical protein
VVRAQHDKPFWGFNPLLGKETSLASKLIHQPWIHTEKIHTLMETLSMNQTSKFMFHMQTKHELYEKKVRKINQEVKAEV